ncbi:MAG: gamma-glutamyl-gamma-aminobutyrate hydrolase family protein [Bacilli bacterium]|nr:gamma-glutamyl-gamma-aminobutyrate hydrolase family protein [Bacilli bacterium]
MKPIIGIVGRCGFTTSDEVNNIRVAEKYRICIIKSGGIPIGIMPPQLVEYQDSAPSGLARLTIEEKEILTRQLDMCDGILIPGGLKRFEYDIFILKYALEKNIPILGICLGMQILTMIDEEGNQILNLEEIMSSNHAQYDNNLAHNVNISKKSKLYSIIGKDKFMVNSRHRMMVTNPSLFTVYGRSDDGVIELIERHDKKFAIGVQWHPEMMLDDKDQMKIFDSFVDACRE